MIDAWAWSQRGPGKFKRVLAKLHRHSGAPATRTRNDERDN